MQRTKLYQIETSKFIVKSKPNQTKRV